MTFSARGVGAVTGVPCPKHVATSIQLPVTKDNILICAMIPFLLPRCIGENRGDTAAFKVWTRWRQVYSLFIRHEMTSGEIISRLTLN